MEESPLGQKATSWSLQNARTVQKWERDEPLIRLGRALADPMRIRILGLLAARSMYGQELAETLKVTPPTISRHLAVLKAAGLVQSQRRHTTQHYYLDRDGLRRSSETLSSEHLQKIGTLLLLRERPASSGGASEQERREVVLAAFFQGGRLVSIPTVAEMRRFVLEQVAQHFEGGRLYSEAEVQAELKTLHDDSANLRRALLDEQLMQHDRGHYWLAQPE